VRSITGVCYVTNLNTVGVLNLVTAQDIRKYVEELKTKRQAAQVQSRIVEHGSIAQPSFPSLALNRPDSLTSLAVMSSRGQQVTHPSDEAGASNVQMCSEDVAMEGVEESRHSDSLPDQRLQDLSLSSSTSSSLTPGSF
jgi:hypothetical protein